jgi:hypothetical protein
MTIEFDNDPSKNVMPDNKSEPTGKADSIMQQMRARLLKFQEDMTSSAAATKADRQTKIDTLTRRNRQSLRELTTLLTPNEKIEFVSEYNSQENIVMTTLATLEKS